MNKNFQIIPSSEIDSIKWDNCVQINKAHIYCRVLYLNTMSINWLGLVYKDYEAVFPICIKQKFGFKYAYTPPFIQQLGCIGNIKTDTNILTKEINKVVSYGDFMFNYNNCFRELITLSKSNFILDLNSDYETIFENYKSDLKQNLKKATKENIEYSSSENINGVIDLYKNIYANRMDKIIDTDFINFKSLCNKLHKTNNCIVRQIKNSNNQILSAALLLIDENRIYNIANATTKIGRKTEANHFLLDRIIHEFSESNLIFDFEGSDIPGVKSFYQKFGAINQPYYHWHFNNLPWWIKWIKK